MGSFAEKLERMVGVEGEDADVRRHHRAHRLLAEATAILRAGSTASHRAQAAEKALVACFGHNLNHNLELGDAYTEFARAANSVSFEADAVSATFARYLIILALARMGAGNAGASPPPG
jgi:hypothetical protein